MTDNIVELTADIVSSYTSANNVAADSLPSLIKSVYAALSTLGQEVPQVVPAELKPAVSVRTSVKPDHISCLECGKKLKMLKRHLMADHGLGVDEYRARWGLARDYPIVAPNYAEQRKELAVKIGLGRKPGARRGRPAKA